MFGRRSANVGFANQLPTGSRRSEGLLAALNDGLATLVKNGPRPRFG